MGAQANFRRDCVAALHPRTAFLVSLVCAVRRRRFVSGKNPDWTDHMHLCEKFFAQSLYKHYIIESPKSGKDNQIDRKAHAQHGNQFPPENGSLGNPPRGGSAPTFAFI